MENYTLEDLISFGEYLLSQERTQQIIEHPDAAKMPPVEERLKLVYPTDIKNWKNYRD
jgi:hypothetical protein